MRDDAHSAACLQDSKKKEIVLYSGDLLVFGGPSRHIEHGVRGCCVVARDDCFAAGAHAAHWHGAA